VIPDRSQVFFARKGNGILASGGDDELLGSAPNHYTMVVSECSIANFDLEMMVLTATKFGK
jgi:hypothetical protein